MTLVIGGPKHGEMVNWPNKNGHGNYAVMDPSRRSILNDYAESPSFYELRRIHFFNYVCDIWVHETIGPFDHEKFADMLVPEILSLKGAHMIESARRES